MGDGIVNLFNCKVFRLSYYALFISLIFSKEKNFISGIVTSEKGDRLKKVPVILMTPSQNIIKSVRTNRKGEFIFKKIDPGSFTIQAKHKILGTGTADIVLKNKSLQLKLTIPSKQVSAVAKKSNEKIFHQNPGAKFFQYWNPYRRSLSIEGNPQTFYGKPYFEVTYNKYKLIKTVKEYDADRNPIQTWNLKWTRSGSRSEYNVKFHKRGSISRLDEKLFSNQLSEVRSGWVATYKSRKDGRPKEIIVRDDIGVHFYTYKFTYASQVDSNIVMEIIESSYFRSDDTFEGRHLVFMESGEWLRMIQYYDKENKSAFTLEYLHDVEKEETIEIQLDRDGKEVSRKIIPFLKPDQFAYSLEWAGRQIIVHELENKRGSEGSLATSKKKLEQQYMSFELLHPFYRDEILDEYPTRFFGTWVVGTKNVIQYGSTGFGTEILWVNHYSKDPLKNLQTLGFFGIARSDMSPVLFFLPDLYRLEYKYGLGIFTEGYGLNIGFSFNPLINIVDLKLVPISTKIGVVGNAVLAKGVLENVDYTYWATIGLSISWPTPNR